MLDKKSEINRPSEVRGISVRNVALYAVLALIGILAGAWAVKSGHPVLAVDEERHNFGVVRAATDVTHVFIIENKGRQPLDIKGLSVSCGCIKQAKMLRTNRVMPGQKEPLQVTFEPPAWSTKVEESVEIHTNDPSTPVKNIFVEATVNASIDIQPSTINFGIVEASQPPVTQTVTINDQLPNPQQDKIKIMMGSKHLRAVSTREGNHWTLAVTLPANTPIGPIINETEIALSRIKPQKLPILRQIVGDIYAEPSEMYLELPETSKPLMQRIEIKSRKEPIISLQILELSAPLKNVLHVDSIRHGVLFVGIKALTLPSPTSKIAGHLLLKVNIAGGATKNLVVPVVLARKS